MKYIKLFEYVKHWRAKIKSGPDFYNIEIWNDHKSGNSSFLLGCSRKKENVDEQLKTYKKLVRTWNKDEAADVNFRILINGVEIMDIDNWEIELIAKKYNV